MKKLLVLLALCMVISVVLVACEDPEQPVVDSSDVTTEAPSEKPTETEPPVGTTDTEPDTGTTDTESDTTPPDTTPDTSDTESDTEPVVVPEDVSKHISFDELDMMLDGNETDVFTPGGSANWDKIANVEDYHVQYLKVWGWLAWVTENIGVYGYSIDGGEAVYDDAFTVVVDPEDAAAGKPVYDAAMGTGAKSVSRFAVMVPVRDLQGEHTITVYAKDVAGTEEVITEFTMNKAVDPDAPVFLANAADMASTIPGSPDIVSAEMSADGKYITINTANTNSDAFHDPYYQLPMLNGKATVASFVAIKYRTSIAGARSEIFVGSGQGPTGSGDNYAFDLVTDGNWNVAIIDLANTPAVVDGVINFLRWDPYVGNEDTATIDMAYVGLFNSAEAAQAYFAKSMIVADNTNTFVSDVDSNEVGTTMDNADLVNFFFTGLPLPGSGVEDLDGAKVYHMTSINELFTNVDGAYFFKANVLSANAAATFFVRGYHVVNSDAIIAAFDPNAGLYKINNYYETDGANAFGGAGIYTSVVNGKLYLLVKYYNADTTTRVGNAVFQVPCEGTELTIADDGYTVSIMVNGVTYATVALSGEQTYADINEVSPAGQFAAKAVVTLKDGTTQTIENTLVAAAPSQVGVASRAGSTKFTSVELGGFSAIEVPALEIVEPEPVDPNAPIAVGDPAYLAGAAMGAGNSQIASAVVSEDGSYVTITTADGNPLDPNFYVLPSGSMVAGVQYIGIKYRTNVAGGGEFFIGSGANPTGGADELKFDYTADGEWHVLILDVTAHEAVVDGLVNYIRYDIFMDSPAGSSIDVANIALFGSLEAANAYYGIEEEPEMETIFYDGTNGTTTVPVEGVKYFVRNAAGMKLTIEGAYNFVVTADNLMGQTVVLQSNMFGVIEVEVPADWFSFELIIDNVCGEAAEFSMSIDEPAPTAEPLVVGDNMVTAIVTKDGWNDTFVFSFTAPEAGDYTFTLTADYATGSLWYFDAPVYGMCEENTVTLTLEAGQTIEIGVSADVVMTDLIGATEDIVYTLGLNIAAGSAAPEEPVTNTANVVIADYAAANAWENSVLYSELKVNEDITVAVSATNPSSYGQNTGKYYNSDASWRIYQNENPSITVTAAEGKTIVSVKVTYISNKTGVLLNGDAQIETDAVIEVNANSITLGVGNTSADVSNGQVRITAIEVIYG